MKKIIILILCLFLVVGCEKKETRTINVLNWTGYIPDSIIRDFENEYGINVNYQVYSSNEELLAKITSSKEGTYDLIFPSDYMVDLMIKRDLVEHIKKERLSNLDNINPLFLNQYYDTDNDYSLPFIMATSVLAIDKNVIKDDIKSYNDLLNKKYKNEIIMLDDQRIIIGACLQALGYDINDVNQEHLEEAYQFFLKLKPNIKAFDSDSPKTFMITKETSIGLIWNAEAILSKDENRNIEIVYPTDGYALSMDNYVIPKGSKNNSDVYLFIDFLLRDENQKRIIDEYPFISTSKNIHQYTDEDLSEIINNGSFISNIGEYIKDYDKLWARMK